MGTQTSPRIIQEKQTNDLRSLEKVAYLERQKKLFSLPKDSKQI